MEEFIEKTRQMIDIVKNYDYKNTNLMEIACFIFYCTKSMNINKIKSCWIIMNNIIEKLENYLLLNYDYVNKEMLNKQKNKLFLEDPDISYSRYLISLWSFFMEKCNLYLDILTEECKKESEKLKTDPDNTLYHESLKSLNEKALHYTSITENLEIPKIMDYLVIIDEIENIFDLICNLYGEHINRDEINELYEDNLKHCIFTKINDKIKSNIDEKIEMIKNDSEELVNQNFYSNLKRVGKDNLLEKYENIKNSLDIELFVINYVKNSIKTEFNQIEEIKKLFEEIPLIMTIIMTSVIEEEKIKYLEEFMFKLQKIDIEFKDKIKFLTEKYYMEDDENIENTSENNDVLLKRIENIFLRIKNKLDEDFPVLCRNLIEKNGLILSDITAKFMIERLVSLKNNVYIKYKVDIIQKESDINVYDETMSYFKHVI